MKKTFTKDELLEFASTAITTLYSKSDQDTALARYGLLVTFVNTAFNPEMGIGKEVE